MGLIDAVCFILKRLASFVVTIQVSSENPSIYAQVLRGIESGKDFMLSKVQKSIDSLSSIPHLEAFQKASQLFEKEREPWKQERLAL